jgi:hypothetical protein
MTIYPANHNTTYRLYETREGKMTALYQDKDRYTLLLIEDIHTIAFRKEGELNINIDDTTREKLLKMNNTEYQSLIKRVYRRKIPRRKRK